ncbi:ankyrin repeat domain-containing protein [Variovorax sp. LT1R20]|uniref:ankyrin repeat domain-containing protein n=1 Tax=Variovorax sp. LT1R20 TaxID=3443729 RepID=UPI003F44AB2A
MPSFAAITPAIIAGDVDAVHHFFKHDLNGNAKAVDICGDTLLHIAARHNKTTEVRAIEVLLIAHCRVEFSTPNRSGICARDMPDQMNEANVSNNDRYREIFNDRLEWVMVDDGPPEKVEIKSRKI